MIFDHVSLYSIYINGYRFLLYIIYSYFIRMSRISFRYKSFLISSFNYLLNRIIKFSSFYYSWGATCRNWAAYIDIKPVCRNLANLYVVFFSSGSLKIIYNSISKFLYCPKIHWMNSFYLSELCFKKFWNC